MVFCRHFCKIFEVLNSDTTPRMQHWPEGRRSKMDTMLHIDFYSSQTEMNYAGHSWSIYTTFGQQREEYPICLYLQGKREMCIITALINESAIGRLALLIQPVCDHDQ